MEGNKEALVVLNKNNEEDDKATVVSNEEEITVIPKGRSVFKIKSPAVEERKIEVENKVNVNRDKLKIEYNNLKRQIKELKLKSKLCYDMFLKLVKSRHNLEQKKNMLKDGYIRAVYESNFYKEESMRARANIHKFTKIQKEAEKSGDEKLLAVAKGKVKNYTAVERQIRKKMPWFELRISNYYIENMKYHLELDKYKQKIVAVLNEHRRLDKKVEEKQEKFKAIAKILDETHGKGVKKININIK